MNSSLIAVRFQQRTAHGMYHKFIYRQIYPTNGAFSCDRPSSLCTRRVRYLGRFLRDAACRTFFRWISGNTRNLKAKNLCADFQQASYLSTAVKTASGIPHKRYHSQKPSASSFYKYHIAGYVTHHIQEDLYRKSLFITNFFYISSFGCSGSIVLPAAG